MGTYILALDQGTTSSRAIVFDRLGDIVSKAQYPFRQLYPQAGWVEHDPMEIWETERRAAAQAAEGLEADIAGIGVTSGRPPFSGTRPPAGPCTTPSCGSAAARRSCARS